MFLIHSRGIYVFMTYSLREGYNKSINGVTNLLVNTYWVITSLLKSECSRYIHEVYSFIWNWFCENGIVLPLVYHNKYLNGVMNLLVNKYWGITSLLKSEFILFIFKRNNHLMKYSLQEWYSLSFGLAQYIN